MSKTRTAKTGANRNSSNGKYQYYKFVNPLAEFSYARYMHGKRLLPDGTYREGDNWQKGLEIEWLMDSLTRHMRELELLHAGYQLYHYTNDDGEHTLIEGLDEIPDGAVLVDLEDVLNAIRFNSEAYKLQVPLGYKKD